MKEEQVLMAASLLGNFEERGNGSVGHEYYALAHMLCLKNVPLFLVQKVVCSYRQLR